MFNEWFLTKLTNVQVFFFCFSQFPHHLSLFHRFHILMFKYSQEFMTIDHYIAKIAYLSISPTLLPRQYSKLQWIEGTRPFNRPERDDIFGHNHGHWAIII